MQSASENDTQHRAPTVGQAILIWMVFTVMAALAQMELEIKRERVNDSNAKRRAAGMDLGGRRPIFSDSQKVNAVGS